MRIEERKILESLTKDHVCVKTQRYLIEEDGTESPIGDLHSIAYINTEVQRDTLEKDQPEEIVNAVFAIWGDVPTVPDPETADKERGGCE